MNSARIARKGSYPQQLLTDTPFHNQTIKENELKAASLRNTVFSTKRTSLAYPNSSNKKTENIMQHSTNEYLEISNFNQSQPYQFPQQSSHGNYYHKVAPFQGQNNIAAQSHTCYNHRNLLSQSLSTSRSLIPEASASPLKRKINEFQKSIESPEKAKRDRSDRDRLHATELNPSRGKIKNVEYFALVKSICKNHGQFHNSPSKINQESQYSHISQEVSNMTEIQPSSTSKNTPRILSDRLQKEDTFGPSLRDLKDFSSDYKQTKLKIIKDRKWLAKTKKMYTEGKIDFRGNNIDKGSQQLLPSNVSLRMFPREDEEYFCLSKQLNTDRIPSEGLCTLKSSNDTKEAHKTLISSNYKLAFDQSPQICDLLTPVDKLSREIYPFRMVESQKQDSSRNSEKIMQHKEPLQLHYKHVNTWQDVSFNEKFNEDNNTRKQVQSEWQSQQNIEGEKQSEKNVRIECPSREGDRLLGNSNLRFYSHRTLKGTDFVLNKEEQKVALLLEKKQSKDSDKFKNYKIASRSELKKESELKKLRKKQRETDSKQIEQLQEALLSRGLIQSEEQDDDLLATKLRIHNFFRQNTLTLAEKQQAYQRLVEQFDVQNDSPSFKRSIQIAQNLRNMKSYYLQRKQESKIVVDFSKKTKSVHDLLQTSQNKYQ